MNMATPHEPERLGMTMPYRMFDAKNRIQSVAMWALLGLSIARAPQTLGADINVRDHVPEPFDVLDHVGNSAVTFALLTHFSHGFWSKEKEAKLQTPDEYESKRKAFA